MLGTHKTSNFTTAQVTKVLQLAYVYLNKGDGEGMCGPSELGMWERLFYGSLVATCGEPAASTCALK